MVDIIIGPTGYQLDIGVAVTVVAMVEDGEVEDMVVVGVEVEEVEGVMLVEVEVEEVEVEEVEVAVVDK
jgi:hypothetical protein